MTSLHQIIGEIDPGYQTNLKDLPIAHVMGSWGPFFEETRRGTKTFDFRKRKKDRTFRPGQFVIMRESSRLTGKFSGRWDLYQIRYVLTKEAVERNGFANLFNADVLGLIHVTGN